MTGLAAPRQLDSAQEHVGFGNPLPAHLDAELGAEVGYGGGGSADSE